MSGTLVHTVFDAAAWLMAGLALIWLKRGAHVRFPAMTANPMYLGVLLLGAGLGAFVFGTANMWLSHQPGLARSIEGAVAGGILAVELYKRAAGIRTRTGARFALPLAVGVAVGRFGCYFAGLDDFTYGTATTLPFGHDFGDGIARHPVQLYESAAMAAFAVLYVVFTRHGSRYVIDNGFYLAVAWYGIQRFVWEFLKPYGTLFGPFTLFHLLSAAIVVYAAVMLVTAPTSRSVDERAFA